ncbi:glycosyltransferase [Lysinibacillus yapensis]|uniref:Glycosyltransferase n=1 Tax=Ureibacillus yapensis TaxID=2304605 RepID=A0A396SKI7_9BACL|nr:glycosyltransferase [Lysinibacillus yapensis]RHW39527.1 glycosyltransferase [Lysinibacillus yapensis]
MKLCDVHIVILSSIKWDFLWQRHQIFAKYLSAYTEVTFVETTGVRNPSIGKALERLSQGIAGKSESPEQFEANSSLKILPPIVAPPTFKFYRKLNKLIFIPRLAKRIKSFSNKPILLITYLPTSTALEIIAQLKPVRTVYDCVLNFENFPNVVHDIQQTENQLIEIADGLIVDSIHLHKKHKAKREDIIQIPAAVDFKHFNKIDRQETLNTAVKKVAYFGGIDHYRMNWDILKRILSENITVELIGPAPEGLPFKHPNLIYREPISHKKLPSALEKSDVLILPYKITEFTKGTFPAKLFECFATGKPIVATALPDIEVFKDVLDIGEDPDSFIQRVLAALQQDIENPNRKIRRIQIARENSWENRCSSLKITLEQFIQ